MDTNRQFEQIIATCRDLFAKKLKDYGAAWRIMRPSSVTDQIFIKANRIRSIETKGTTVKNLCKLNGITTKTTLRIGQVLRLY